MKKAKVPKDAPIEDAPQEESLFKTKRGSIVLVAEGKVIFVAMDMKVDNSVTISLDDVEEYAIQRDAVKPNV